MRERSSGGPDRRWRLGVDGARGLASRPCPEAAKALDLKTIWLFSNCTASELTQDPRLARRGDRAHRARCWCEEGRIGTEFFIIVSGTAAVTRNGKKVATLGPGQPLRRAGPARPQAPVGVGGVRDRTWTLLVLSQRQFNGLLESVPTIARKMLAAMANRLREADALAFD